jgi:glyoxylate/succinic semialdehyde reductase
MSAADSADTVPTPKKIGFLGCGIMGVPMAINLIKAGHEVTVWNRTSNAADPVVQAGGTLAISAAEACAASDVTFVMVSTPEAALAVAQSAVSGLSAGKGYVDVSTVDAATSSAVSDIVKATGAMFLEAPVSGSKKPAEDGALIFLCAGDEELYARVQAPLETMGKAHFYLGPVGQGAKMKLVVNMIMGSMMGAFAEGLSLSEKCDLDPETLLRVVSLGAIATPMYAMKGPSMIAGKFPPAFPLKHQQKDMRLALALADELAQEMPVAAAANELYKRARRDGCDDEDFSAVLKAVKKMP